MNVRHADVNLCVSPVDLIIINEKYGDRTYEDS